MILLVSYFKKFSVEVIAQYIPLTATQWKPSIFRWERCRIYNLFL